MLKPKIGDIIEIKTEKGPFYAQYTHKNREYGELLIIFREGGDGLSADFSNIEDSDVLFSFFFPLASALKKGMVSVVANRPVSIQNKKFPLFRSGVADLKSGKVNNWWLWDGENEWRVGQLTPDQRKLSIRGIWNYAYLIDRLESGWTPETDLM